MVGLDITDFLINQNIKFKFKNCGNLKKNQQSK